MRLRARPTVAALLAEARRFLLFALVGTAGFLTEAIVLTLLVALAGLGPYAARAASFAVAVTVTWALNRAYTYADKRDRSHGAEYRRYVGTQIGGLLVNLAVYALAIESHAGFRAYPVAALALGSLAGLIVNYVLARLVVFRGAGRG